MKKLLEFKEVKIALALILVIGIYGIINIDGTIGNFYQRVVNQNKKEVLYRYTTSDGTVSLESSTYDLSKEAIYVGKQINEDDIKSKITIEGTGVLEVGANKLKLKSDRNLLLKEWELITATSSKYDDYMDISYPYIITGFDRFNNNDISVNNTNAKVSSNENQVTITYNNESIKTWTLEYFTTDYQIVDRHIIPDSTGIVDINKIQSTPNLSICSLGVQGSSDLYVCYNHSPDTSKQVYLVNWSSNTYDLTKDYIYIGKEGFVQDEIIVSNAKRVIEGNTVKIKVGDIVVKEWKLIVSSIYSDYMDKDYIYTGKENFNSNNIGTDLTKEYDQANNKFRLKDGNQIIKEWDIITVLSDQYANYIDLDYIYTGFKKFDINNININSKLAKLSSSGNQITIKYNNESIKTWTIETLSTDNYLVNNKTIISHGTIDSSKITSNSSSLRAGVFSVAQNAPRSIYIYIIMQIR